MGNIVSRKKSNREKLIEIDDKIKFYESRKRDILKTSKSRGIFVYICAFIFVFISIFYAYFEKQNLILYSVSPILISYTVKFLFTAYYNFRLESIEAYVIELKDMQKEIVDKIKAEDDFYKTKELLDKLENKDKRFVYFSNIKQEKKGVSDSLADIVLGEDPSKNYALICSDCHYHNGMIPPEEYNGLEFVCYNCEAVNKKGKKKINKDQGS